MSDLRTALIAAGAVQLEQLATRTPSLAPASAPRAAAHDHRCNAGGCNAPAQVAYGYCVRCSPPGRTR